MEKMSLKDLLNLTDEEINNSKITLSVWDNKKQKFFYDEWKESDYKNVDFAFYQTKKSYLKKDMIVFGFIQSPLDNKKWVLCGAVKILEDTPIGKTCKYEKISRFNGMVGRLWIELSTGKRYGYAYYLSTYLDKCIVLSIDNIEKEVLQFKGFDNVSLTYEQLKAIISNENSDYFKILSNIKGVYCLTDTKTGKLYIGSASGNEGISNRWASYIISEDGGNKELIKLKTKNKGNYIKKYFIYTLLEFYDMNVSRNYVLSREKYWKKVFDSVKHGYNDN